MGAVDLQIQNNMADMAMQQRNKMPDVARMKNSGEDAIRKTAKEFESMYLAQMLRPMFEGIEAEAPFGGGQAENMWRSLQIDEYGKAISEAGGIGLADAVVREMIMLQEASQ